MPALSAVEEQTQEQVLRTRPGPTGRIAAPGWRVGGRGSGWPAGPFYLCHRFKIDAVRITTIGAQRGIHSVAFLWCACTSFALLVKFRPQSFAVSLYPVASQTFVRFIFCVYVLYYSTTWPPGGSGS